jgi:hypothetical protein
MVTQKVALVSQIDKSKLSFSDLSTVAAALRQQAMNDFGPVWNIDAAVDPYELDQVPADYWPVVIVDQLPPGEGGVHEDENGQPISFVAFQSDWNIAASHETLEMLADPFGRRMVSGPSLMPDQGRVNYLLEVCDPCEGPDFSYTIDGVTVSDFITPDFHAEQDTDGAQYSFTGSITSPRQILNAGYISWQDPGTGHWFQAFNHRGEMSFKDLGPVNETRVHLRKAIHKLAIKNNQPQAKWWTDGLPPDHRHAAMRANFKRSATAGGKARANSWRKDFARFFGR